jgi:hypothetical protein
MHHICAVMPHLPINNVAIVLQCIVSGSRPSMLTHHFNEHEKMMKLNKSECRQPKIDISHTDCGNYVLHMVGGEGGRLEALARKFNPV